MNKLLYKLFLVLNLAVVVSSCKKYAEGPWLSFESKKERVANDWSFSSVIINDENKNIDFQGALLSLNKSGALNFNFDYVVNGVRTTQTQTGEWALTNTNNNLILTFKDNQGSYTKEFTILELKEKRIHLKSLDMKDDWILIPNYLR